MEQEEKWLRGKAKGKGKKGKKKDDDDEEMAKHSPEYYDIEAGKNKESKGQGASSSSGDPSFQ